MSLTERLSGDSIRFGVIRPVIDVSGGLAWNNIGDEVTYIDPDQADPLPRTARAGIGIQGGITADIAGGWELLFLAWTREAEDLLVVRHADGTWEYQSGLGDIDLGGDLFAGNPTDNVVQRSGWQVQAGEIFTYRKGSVEVTYSASNQNIMYETSGFTIRLAGALKAIAVLAATDLPAWLLFARDHIDIQYHRAEYEQSLWTGGATTFSGFTLSFQGMPW